MKYGCIMEWFLREKSLHARKEWKIALLGSHHVLGSYMHGVACKHAWRFPSKYKPLGFYSLASLLGPVLTIFSSILDFELFISKIDLRGISLTSRRTDKTEISSSGYSQNRNTFCLRLSIQFSGLCPDFEFFLPCGWLLFLERNGQTMLMVMHWNLFIYFFIRLGLGTKFSVHSLPLFTYFLFDSIGDDYPPILL